MIFYIQKSQKEMNNYYQNVHKKQKDSKIKHFYLKQLFIDKNNEKGYLFQQCNS